MIYKIKEILGNIRIYVNTIYNKFREREIERKRTIEAIRMLKQGRLYEVEPDKINWGQVYDILSGLKSRVS